MHVQVCVCVCGRMKWVCGGRGRRRPRKTRKATEEDKGACVFRGDKCNEASNPLERQQSIACLRLGDMSRIWCAPLSPSAHLPGLPLRPPAAKTESRCGAVTIPECGSLPARAVVPTESDIPHPQTPNPPRLLFYYIIVCTTLLHCCMHIAIAMQGCRTYNNAWKRGYLRICSVIMGAVDDCYVLRVAFGNRGHGHEGGFGGTKRAKHGAAPSTEQQQQRRRCDTCNELWCIVSSLRRLPIAHALVRLRYRAHHPPARKRRFFGPAR